MLKHGRKNAAGVLRSGIFPYLVIEISELCCKLLIANHHNNGGPDDEWYLFVDVIPSIGYRPMVSRDLDQGWMPLQADDYFLTAHTKHGGVASLTRAEYDRLAQHVHAF